MTFASSDLQLEELMRRHFPDDVVEATHRLAGGVSANATRVDLRAPGGGVRRVVVRRPWANDRDVALRAIDYEARALALAKRLDIPAPCLVVVDIDAAAIIVDFVPGAPLLSPSNLAAVMRAMAKTLARIHATAGLADVDFLQPMRNRAERMITSRPSVFDDSLDEERLRGALEALWPWSQRNPDVLLHGDFWPGNLLWRNEELQCVLDWEEPALGDPLADLAIARLDVLWVYGEEAMDVFTASYREHTDLDWTCLPHWDLCVALRPMSQLSRWAPAYGEPPIGRPDITQATMTDGHHRFVTRALAALGM